MIDTSEFTQHVRSASSNAARIFSPHAEADDIAGDIWVWLLENQKWARDCMNDTEGGEQKLRSAISQRAREYGQKYKAAALGYSVDDVMKYSTKALERLLPDVFDHEDWQSFGQHGDGQPAAKGLANTTGDHIAELVDVADALLRLRERDYNVLVWRFKYQLTQDAIAAELGITQQGAGKAVTTALRALQKELGAKAQDSAETLADGPGTRRVMSNASWRAQSSRQWDGE